MFGNWRRLKCNCKLCAWTSFLKKANLYLQFKENISTLHVFSASCVVWERPSEKVHCSVCGISLLCGTRKVQCSVCGMRGTQFSCRGWEWSTGSAVCGAQRVVGSVWYAVPGMRCVVCIALFTITYQCVWYAVCGMRKQWSTGIAAGLISSILSALHSPVSEPHNFEFHFLCLSSFWLEALDKF